MTKPGRMPATQAQSGKGEHGAPAKRGRSPALAAAAGVRGRPRKVTPNALTKQAAASAADRASIAPTAGTISFEPQDGTVRAQQNGLKGQPLGDEAVERRQRRDRHAPDEESERGQRHAMDEAAEMLHVALAGRGQHGAGAEEQQALEEAVVEDMEQRRGQRQRRGGRHAVRRERERQAEADEDDADILDGVVGEQPLEVVLHQRAEHAEHAGDAGERDHRRRSTTRPADR